MKVILILENGTKGCTHPLPLVQSAVITKAKPNHTRMFGKCNQCLVCGGFFILWMD